MRIKSKDITGRFSEAGFRESSNQADPLHEPTAQQLSRNLKCVYAPLKNQLSPRDYVKAVLRPYYAPIGTIFPYIEDGTSVIEIGCGMGPVIFSLAGYFKFSNYLGIDTDAHVLQVARMANQYPHFSFSAGALSDIPKSRLSEFRTFLCFDVLHHIPRGEKRNFLSYLIDAACRDALIIIKDFDARPRLRTMANDLTDWLSTRSAVSYMPKEALIKHLTARGCRIVDVKKKNMWVWSHLLVIARKTGAMHCGN